MEKKKTKNKDQKNNEQNKALDRDELFEVVDFSRFEKMGVADGEASGDTRVDKAILEAGLTRVESIAATLAKRPTEGPREGDAEKAEAENRALIKLKEELATAYDEKRRREAARAHAGELPKEPEFPSTELLACGAAIGMTVIMTAHDCLFAGLLSSTYAWFASVIASLVIGGAVIGVIFWSEEVENEAE